MYSNKKIAVIIAAAGSGTRMGSQIPKQFIQIRGKSVLERSVQAFEYNSYIDEILIVASEEYADDCSRFFLSGGNFQKVTQVVHGGVKRQDSVYAALQKMDDSVDIILIHDGARPFVTQEVIHRVVEKTEKDGAAVAAVPVKDTIKEAVEGVFIHTLERDQLRAVQTPQGFLKKRLLEAYEAAYEDDFFGTDDAVLMERLGDKVHVSLGDYRNIKITTAEDLLYAEAILGKEGKLPRVGMGYDVHRLVEERKCILGGVEIPFEKGLLGHSDADVLIHAVMDALLGAAALGDIGAHFPDTDEKYQGVSSMNLLKQVCNILDTKGYMIGNIDATLIAQRPKIAPYIDEMRSNIANALKIKKECVSIKGTTTERLGFCGREEGIACEAVSLILER